MKFQIRVFSLAILVLTAFTATSQEAVPEYTVQVGNYTNLKRGEGCEKCGGTGLSGRQAIFEVLNLYNFLM